jgi:integrin alpha FG-GAP repeat containing protein 1
MRLKNQDFASFPIASLLPQGSSLLLVDTTFSPALPIPIRIGDADLDGFPDLLPIVASKSGTSPTMLFSKSCSKGGVGCKNKDGRTFVPLDEDINALADITDARGVTFLDMDEDVSADYPIVPHYFHV